MFIFCRVDTGRALRAGLLLLLAAEPSWAQPPAQDADAEKVQALVKDLQSDKEATRLAALEALEKLGPKAEPAAAALVELLQKDKSEDIRLNAALVVGRIGKGAVPTLARVLDAKEDHVRFYAVWSLGLIGKDARETTAAVARLLQDGNDDVRRKAAYALGRFAPEAEAALPALAKGLADTNEAVREAVVEALLQFDARAAPHLLKAVREGNAQVRDQARTILAKIPKDAEVLAPLLIPLLKDDNVFLQEIAEQNLTRQGHAVIPYLIPALKDRNVRIRQGALRILHAVDVDVPRMFGPLRELLKDDNPDVRESAVVLLSRLGAGVVPHLAAALRDTHPSVRWTAAYSLGQMGAAAQDAIPALAAIENDPDPEVRAQVQNALGRIRGKK